MYFYSFEGLGCNFAGVSIVFFLMIALLAPMILALVLNSYMHSKKASDVYHAIPVSRGTLLTANAAVGMTIVGLPLAASNLFIMAVQIAKFGFLPDVTAYLWLDALGWMICGFAIYAVTTFVSVCVGTVFDTFVLSGTLLLAAPVLSALGLTVTELFLFGWSAGVDALTFVTRLSPVTLMIERFAIADGTLGASSPIRLFGPDRLPGREPRAARLAGARTAHLPGRRARLPPPQDRGRGDHLLARRPAGAGQAGGHRRLRRDRRLIACSRQPRADRFPALDGAHRRARLRGGRGRPQPRLQDARAQPAAGRGDGRRRRARLPHPDDRRVRL